MLNNLLIAQAAIAGALLPFQAVLNAAVGRSLGHPLSAAVVNFIIGFAGLITLATVLRVPFPQFGSLGTLPWYYWIGGGLAGAFFVFTSLFVAPRIGVTALLAGVLAGQLLASVAMDHFGLLGLQSQPVSLGKVAGVALLVAGVIMVRRF
ncbi:MAG: DMT family transporter [Myxococcota bacterium]|nr:DMT family transporter [Myxococcota bacterium]